MKWFVSFLVVLLSIGGVSSLSCAELVLRNNLQRAQPGDYIVISAGKTQTLLLIIGKKDPFLTIEEIAVPESKRQTDVSWKEWVKQGSPGNTSWVRYDVDLQTGKMVHYYSFTKKNWFEIADADNFLSKLLNLKFTLIPENARKRLGPKPRSGPEMRPVWQPRLIMDGKQVDGVIFDAWRTRWPRDNSDLSEKAIEVYLPRDSQRYPSYFPYWLQINGAIGKAKVRIIDSGNQLQSPQKTLPGQ